MSRNFREQEPEIPAGQQVAERLRAATGRHADRVAVGVKSHFEDGRQHDQRTGHARNIRIPWPAARRESRRSRQVASRPRKMPRDESTRRKRCPWHARRPGQPMRNDDLGGMGPERDVADWCRRPESLVDGDEPVIRRKPRTRGTYTGADDDQVARPKRGPSGATIRSKPRQWGSRA